jgi:RND superfamily putative drug exporter
MSARLHRIGAACAAHPWRTIVGWLCAAAVVLGLAGVLGAPFADNYTLPGKDSQRATELLRQRMPELAGASARVVVHASGAQDLDSAVLADVTSRLRSAHHVDGVEPPQVSPDGRTAILGVRYDAPVTDVDPPAAVEQLEQAADPAVRAGLQVELGGEVPDQIMPTGSAELIGVAAAAIILLVAFGTVLAAGLPLLLALTGLGVGMALVSLLAAVSDVSTTTPTVAAMMGIGVGIDYALFVVDRFRRQMLAGDDVVEAAATAVATAGRSVVVAGGTVLVALSGLVLSGLPNFQLMGIGVGLVVAVCVVTAVTLLPALLRLAGRRVLRRRSRRALTVGTVAAGKPAKPASARPALAARWAAQATRHPWRYAAVSLVLLLALSAPVLGMQLGQSDAGSEPTSSTTRRAYDLVDAAFGPGANGPLLLVDDLTVAGAPSPEQLSERLAATPGVVAVGRPVVDAAGTTAVLTAVPSTGPQDDATDALVRGLRAELPRGVHVTGATAAYIDFNALVQEHLPRVVLVVVIASFALLVLLLRSVVAPLKAALMNLLSVGAAFGAITALFQWGWGARVLGLDGPVPVSSFVPLFVFAALFGLSMDYEVFLLSSIRESWDRNHDRRLSVVEGVGSTARVITSAAAIMIAVFCGFALDSSVAVKMIGTGLAVAVLVDATLVRLVLVPATMTLLGRWNWWLPAWLDRLLPGAAHVPDGVPRPEDVPVVGAEPTRVPV